MTATVARPRFSSSSSLSLSALDSAVPTPRERSQLVGSEVEVAAIPVVQFGGGVVDEGDRHVGLPVQVDVHRADHGLLAGEEHVLCVGPPAGPQQDAAAPLDARAVDDDHVGRGATGRPPRRPTSRRRVTAPLQMRSPMPP